MLSSWWADGGWYAGRATCPCATSSNRSVPFSGRPAGSMLRRRCVCHLPAGTDRGVRRMLNDPLSLVPARAPYSFCLPIHRRHEGRREMNAWQKRSYGDDGGTIGQKERFKDGRHDPYLERAKHLDPPRCAVRGRVFTEGRRSWKTAPPVAPEINGPACRRTEPICRWRASSTWRVIETPTQLRLPEPAARMSDTRCQRAWDRRRYSCHSTRTQP